MKAILRNYRQSPRKVALVGDAIRNKEVSEALTLLRFMDQKASIAVAKLVRSAVAAVKDQGGKTENLTIKQLVVDKGPTQYRHRPRARGRTAQIAKQTSHITIEVL